MQLLNRLIVLSALIVSASAPAETVELTARELAAVSTLLKPDSTTLTFHGREGVFEPAPSFRYLGVETMRFDIDMSFILDLLDLRFDRVVGRNPVLRFVPGAFEIQMSFDDRVGALRSHLGRIDCENVRLTAILDWKDRAGKKELELKGMRFSGTLRGKGIMGTKLVINRTKKLAMKLFANQIDKILRQEEMQESIRAGLTQWARMTLGNKRVVADPTTFAFIGQGNSGAISFEAVSE